MTTSQLTKQTLHLFENNLKEGYSDWSKHYYRYIAPSNNEYPFQWQWDTAFHSIVLSRLDPHWAQTEIKNFLLGARHDGFLPHVIYWESKRALPHWSFLESLRSRRPHTSSLTQPPLLPVAVEHIFNKTLDINFLRDVLPPLEANHRWLLGNRDPDGDGLLSIISPNESGLDELPVFQVAMGYTGNNSALLHYYYRLPDFRNQQYKFDSVKILTKDYFNMEELVFNCVFIESSRSLSRLYLRLGNNPKSGYFAGIAGRAQEALLAKCWDDNDEIFYSIYSKSEKKARVKTIASLLPLFLEKLPREYADALVHKHLMNKREFWTKYPIPSVAIDEPYYMPSRINLHKLIWRGPTWINTNWFIVEGLRKHGYHAIANEIVKRTLKLVEKEGFREYYNPETGEGYSHHNFAWSTLIVDMVEA